MRKEREEDEQIEGKDPFLFFGFGIMSYRNTIINLFYLFVVFSLITNPLLRSYQSGNAIGEDIKTKFGRQSLSNLGYASMQCQNVPIGMQKVVLSCPYGLMTQIVPNGLGVTPNTSTKKDACLVDEKLYQNQHCSNMID